MTKGKVTNFEKRYIYIRKKDEYFEILIEKFSNHITMGKNMGLLNMREFDTKRFNWEIIFLYKKEIYIFEVFMIFNILRLKIRTCGN